MCQGTIAPLDVKSASWRYPNIIHPYERENWWQWTPDNFSKQKLLAEANSTAIGTDGMLGKYTQIFKSGIPFQVGLQRGRLLDIQAVPIHKLADMTRNTCKWIFEFETSK